MHANQTEYDKVRPVIQLVNCLLRDGDFFVENRYFVADYACRSKYEVQTQQFQVVQLFNLVVGDQSWYCSDKVNYKAIREISFSDLSPRLYLLYFIKETRREAEVNIYQPKNVHCYL